VRQLRGSSSSRKGTQRIREGGTSLPPAAVRFCIVFQYSLKSGKPSSPGLCIIIGGEVRVERLQIANRCHLDLDTLLDEGRN